MLRKPTTLKPLPVKTKKMLPPNKGLPNKKVDPKVVLLNAKLQKELEADGVVLFRPTEHGGSLNINEDYLTLPADITNVPGHVIGEYLNAFTQQKLYMRTLFGEMQCIVEECRRMYDRARIEIYRELSKDRLSETAKETIINNNEDVFPHYERWVDAKLKLSMIEQNIDNIADAIFLISREVSRRDGDFKHEQRNFSVGRVT